MPDAIKTVCPRCHALNRVLADRLGQGPVCGKCGAVLLPAAPLELDESGFDRLVANSELPVLVDFFAPWCGPCKMMAPAFEQAARRLHPGVILAKVDTEREQSLAARMGIRSVPTLAMFCGGREVARQPGALDANALVRWAMSTAHAG